MNSEVGATISQSYSVSPPVASSAQANSGWTLGVTQVDANTNSSNFSTLLEQALTQSGIANLSSNANAIAAAYVAAKTGSTVNLPDNITTNMVNAGLESVSNRLINVPVSGA